MGNKIDFLPWMKVIAADPGDMVSRDVFADWLEENGFFRHEAYGWYFIQSAAVYNFGIGSGRGRGSGSGNGTGSGSGSGLGRGGGSGSGSGLGRGGGSGSASGAGGGIGRGISNKGEVYMEPGKAYLLHQGDWHTFVGRCVRQVGPFTYLFIYVSQIDQTNNGANWEKLAAGDKAAREACSYRHERTEQVFPLTIRASLWLGKTPAEEAGITMLEELEK